MGLSDEEFIDLMTSPTGEGELPFPLRFVLWTRTNSCALPDSFSDFYLNYTRDIQRVISANATAEVSSLLAFSIVALADPTSTPVQHHLARARAHRPRLHDPFGPALAPAHRPPELARGELALRGYRAQASCHRARCSPDFARAGRPRDAHASPAGFVRAFRVCVVCRFGEFPPSLLSGRAIADLGRESQRYIYKYGLQATSVDFYNFLTALHQQ